MLTRVRTQGTLKRKRDPKPIHRSDVESILKLKDDGWTVVQISGHVNLDPTKVARIMVHPDLYTTQRPCRTVTKARAILNASVNPLLLACHIAAQSGINNEVTRVKRYLTVKNVIVEITKTKDCTPYGNPKKKWASMYKANDVIEIEDEANEVIEIEDEADEVIEIEDEDVDMEKENKPKNNEALGA